MIKIGILGDIGSGKTYVAKNFGYPVFNADREVSKIYRNNKKVFTRLKRVLPKYIYSFPVKKNEVIKAILANKSNLKKIIDIIHVEVRKKMNDFLKKNKKRKFLVLDIPLLLENKINKKNDILIFVQSNKKDTLKRLRKRSNYNRILIHKFRYLQLSLDYKKKKSHFIIKNKFTKSSVKKGIKVILRKINKWKK